MATIQQQIEVAADPTLVRSTWSRFIKWVHTGPGHLLCDELACVDAVRAGLVEFVPTTTGATTVIFRMDQVAGGPPPEELRRRVNHDLVVFKDYVERSGLARRKPRHVHLSSKDDATFGRSHFPT